MSRQRATAAEVEVRRAAVLRLRLAKLSESEIAKELKVSTATISRDLAAVKEAWAERFRTEFDPLHEVGEGISVYELLEGSAIRELDRLEKAEPGATTLDKMRCVATAKAIRQARIDFLLVVGFFNTPLNGASRLPTADEIRRAILAARVPNALIPQADQEMGPDVSIV
jgi:hypothetical protein